MNDGIKTMLCMIIVTICIVATCVSYIFVVVNLAMKLFAICALISIILVWVYIFRGVSND